MPLLFKSLNVKGDKSPALGTVLSKIKVLIIKVFIDYQTIEERGDYSIFSSFFLFFAFSCHFSCHPAGKISVLFAYISEEKVNEDNIHDGLIEFVQPKTGGRVFLPVSPRVSDVLSRYGGRARAPPPRSSISLSPLKPSVNFSSSITFYDSIPYLNNSTKI